MIKETHFALVLVSFLSGCDQGIMCPLPYLARATGSVVDADGEPVLPDRILLVGDETDECEIDPLGWGGSSGQAPGHFTCYGSGDTLLIYVGNETMEVDVPQAKDECGLDVPELEIAWE